MGAIRILIADQNEAFRENLADLLRARYTVQTSGDGKDALALLDSFAPDILVMDLMLPNIDGFFLLQHASDMESPPEIMVITRYLSVYIQEKILAAGIHSMMRKPCDLLAAESNVRAIAQRLPEALLRREGAAVTDLLLRLGFQTHLDGFKQLQLVIPMFARDPRQPLNKVIYAAVAKKFGLSGEKPVERSIRAAIDASWRHGDPELWNRLFPAELRKPSKAPSNKIFVSRIVEYFHREQGIR